MIDVGYACPLLANERWHRVVIIGEGRGRGGRCAGEGSSVDVCHGEV